MTAEESVRKGIEFRKEDIKNWNERYRKALKAGNAEVAAICLAEAARCYEDIKFLQGGCLHE